MCKSANCDRVICQGRLRCAGWFGASCRSPAHGPAPAPLGVVTKTSLICESVWVGRGPGAWVASFGGCYRHTRVWLRCGSSPQPPSRVESATTLPLGFYLIRSTERSPHCAVLELTNGEPAVPVGLQVRRRCPNYVGRAMTAVITAGQRAQRPGRGSASAHQERASPAARARTPHPLRGGLPAARAAPAPAQ